MPSMSEVIGQHTELADDEQEWLRPWSRVALFADLLSISSCGSRPGPERLRAAAQIRPTTADRAARSMSLAI
jgi:hypothetical protein